MVESWYSSHSQSFILAEGEGRERYANESTQGMTNLEYKTYGRVLKHSL
jgi:hypothetical protein